MTIINPNSIAGITSVTAEAGVMNFYKSDGTLAGLQLNGVNFNTTSGISTFNNLYVGGTITYEDVKNVDSVGIVTAREGIFIPDSKKLQLGNAAGSADLQIFHNTNDSVISQSASGTGNLKILSGGAQSIECVKAGAVNIAHNGSTKLATTSSGVSVTGTVAATSYTGDGSALTGVASTEFVHAQTHAVVGMTTLTGAVSFGGTATFKVNQKLYFNDGANNTFGSAYIYGDNYNLIVKNDNAAGSSYFSGNTCNLQGGGGNKTGIRVSGSNGDVEFFHNNGIIGETHSNGEGGIDIKESLRHYGDLDTKIKFGTDTITAETGGSERVRIDSNGDLRIGNTTQTFLDAARNLVVGGGGGSEGITIYSSSSDAGIIAFADGTSDPAYRMGQIMYDHGGNQMIFRTNGNNTRLTIKSDGNIIPGTNNSTSIGDGTTNFASIWASTRFRGNDNVKLILGNSQNLSIRHDGAYNIIGSPVADDLHIKSGTGDNDNQLIAAFKHSNASVGIGTTNPVGNLEVRDSKANLIVAKDGLTVKSNSDLATQYDLIQLGAGGALASYSTATATADTQFIHNAYRHSGGNWKYRYADTAMRLRMNSPGGAFIFESAASGSADADITFLEKLRITSDGDMGLGATNPGADPAIGNDATVFEIRQTTTGNITSGNNRKGAVLRLKHEAQWENGYQSNTPNDDLGRVEFVTGDSSTGEGVRSAIRCRNLQYYNMQALTFEVATANSTSLEERVRIESNGDVAINTTDGDFSQTNGASQFAKGDPKLGVLGSIGIANFSSTTTDFSQLAFYRRTKALPESDGSHRITSTSNLGRIAWFGASNDTSFPDEVQRIECIPNGGDWWAGSGRRASMRFTSSGAPGTGEYLRFTSSGQVHIGTSGELGNAHSGIFQVIHTGGGNLTNDCLTFLETNSNDWCMKTNYNQSSSSHYHIDFMEEGSRRGTIMGSDGSNVAFTPGSDYRMKENIVDLTGTEGINYCKNLIPRKYNWIDNRKNTGKINTVNGFIAHEVEEAGIGHLVYGNGKDAVNEDGSIDPQTLDYAGMTPILAAAIKGLITKVETLEAEVASLKSS